MTEREKEPQFEIQYPCVWEYKAIGHQKETLREVVDSIFQERTCEIVYSKGSSSGKYHSFNIEMEVQHEEERNHFYRLLKKSSHVLIVI